jgi:hypothetical protein
MKKIEQKKSASAGTDNGQKRLKKTINPHQYIPSSGDVSREDIENYPAVRYLKTFAQAVQSKTTGNRECSILCSDCPFAADNNGSGLHCTQLEMQQPRLAVEIAIRWEREHKHTYLDEFFNWFPEAFKTVLDVKIRNNELCRCNFFDGKCPKRTQPSMTCWQCWNQLYIEHEESEK